MLDDYLTKHPWLNDDEVEREGDKCVRAFLLLYPRPGASYMTRETPRAVANLPTLFPSRFLEEVCEIEDELNTDAHQADAFRVGTTSSTSGARRRRRWTRPSRRGSRKRAAEGNAGVDAHILRSLAHKNTTLQRQNATLRARLADVSHRFIELGIALEIFSIDEVDGVVLNEDLNH